MGLFDKVKKTTIESRRYEEKLYEVALEEVEAGEVRKGLYAKALSKADGDKEKADGIYLKLRVQSIMDDIESEQIDRREVSKEVHRLAMDIKSVSREECEKLLNSKGYQLKKSLLGEYQVLDGCDYTSGFGSTRMIVFVNRELFKVYQWAEKAPKAPKVSSPSEGKDYTKGWG
jgi:hypothetical protein